jgi:hypothetical protein
VVPQAALVVIAAAAPVRAATRMTALIIPRPMTSPVFRRYDFLWRGDQAFSSEVLQVSVGLRHWRRRPTLALMTRRAHISAGDDLLSGSPLSAGAVLSDQLGDDRPDQAPNTHRH